MVVVDSEKKNELAELKKKRKKKEKYSIKVFAAPCISLMHGGNVNYSAMSGVVRKVCIVEQLVKMLFFAMFPLITNMFVKAAYIFIYIY